MLSLSDNNQADVRIRITKASSFRSNPFILCILPLFACVSYQVEIN